METISPPGRAVSELETISPQGSEPAIRIGIDSFSYHRFFGETGPWEQDSAVRWTTQDFLQRAAALGVDGVALQTAYLPTLTLESVVMLRADLERLGLRPVLCWGHRTGLEGGTNPEKVVALRQTLPVAKRLGCDIVRIVCGDQFSWTVPARVRMERLRPILQEVAREASTWGVALAIENHADVAMADLVTLVEAVGAPNLGICFDTGNTVRVGDDLLAAVDLAGPHVLMVHLKDVLPQTVSRGDPAAWWPSTPLGRGALDLPAVIAGLRSHGFAGTLFIEMANMWPDWPDEDAAVAESVAYLRRYQPPANTSGSRR